MGSTTSPPFFPVPTLFWFPDIKTLEHRAVRGKSAKPIPALTSWPCLNLSFLLEKMLPLPQRIGTAGRPTALTKRAY
jgi:hypothetical protein